MAFIFGVRLDTYSLGNPPLSLSHVNPNSRTNPTDGRYNGGAVTEWKNSRRYKKRDDDNNSSGGATKKKHNKKRVSK